MACDDRQLTEAQRQAAFQQQRTGVQRAVRPFTGRPTLDNLIDYINRELQPAVKQSRDAVNDIYLQVADQAPSANPLAFYFSTATANADPTNGRVRLNASPQNTATAIRLSQTNGRLADVGAWLDVMAGSSTEPLGVVTLFDAINPSRFLRFDLSTMVDQGDYWDLGVVITESSHADPFVEAEAVVVAFIPGVASTGATVPATSLSPIAANTVLGNATASTAAPTAIPLNALSVLGRSSGNITAITAATGGGRALYLRTNDTTTAVAWATISEASLPLLLDGHIYANMTGATSAPIGKPLAGMAGAGLAFNTATLGDYQYDITVGASLALTATSGGQVERAALTGDVTATQNSNTTAFRSFTALSVLARAANTSGAPADLAAANDGEVLRRSGTSLGFGTVATAGLADDSVTNAKLAEMAANTVKANATSSTANPTDFAVGTNSVLGRVAGDIVAAQLVTGQITDANVTLAKLANLTAGTAIGRQVDASTGVPVALTGQEQAESFRRETIQTESGVSGTLDILLAADTTVLLVRTTADTTIRTMSDATGLGGGREIVIEHDRLSGTGNLTIAHNTAGTYTPFFNPDTSPIVLGQTTCLTARLRLGFWRPQGSAQARIRDADYGDITVSASGATWTIDNDVVSDAKLRNSAALSVIGRSANSTGDPADIAAANDGEVLRRSGTALGFGTLATAGHADNSVTDAKLRDSGALSVIGRSANSSGDPADISATAASGAVLRESGSVLGFGTVVAAGLASDSVTTVKILDANVTNAKLANMAQRTVKGRQTDAAAGVPVDLSGAEVCEIIRRDTIQTVSSASGTLDVLLADDTTVLLIRTTADATLRTMSAGTGGGREIVIEHDRQSGSGNLTIAHNTAGTYFPFFNPATSDVVLGQTEGITVRDRSGFWRCNTIGVVANIRFADMAANTVKANATGSTAKPTDFAVGTNSVLGRVAGNIVAAQVVAGQIASDAVTTAKILDANVTLAKMADLAQSRIIGRAEGAGTGVPTALTPTQVVAIIDGESPQWSASHRFDSFIQFGTSTALPASGDIRKAGTLLISTADDLNLTALDNCTVDISNTLTLDGGAAVQVASANLIQLQSSNDITFGATDTISVQAENTSIDQGTFCLADVNGSTTATENNFSIAGANVARFNGTTSLTGMVSGHAGQIAVIVNAHTSLILSIENDHGASSAANRFLLDTTSRWVRPNCIALAWYDGTSSRWRLITGDRTVTL